MPTDPPTSPRVLARRAAAKLLGELADAPACDEQITESVRDDFREVLVIILPVRWGAVQAVELMSVREALAEFLSLTPSAPAEPPVVRDLRPIHTRLLALLTATPKTRKTLARELRLSQRSSHIRQGLADLVRMGLAKRAAEGYSIL